MGRGKQGKQFHWLSVFTCTPIWYLPDVQVLHPAAYSNPRLVLNTSRNWEVIHQNYKHCRQAWTGFLSLMKVRSSRYHKKVRNSLKIITILLLKKKWSLPFYTWFSKEIFLLCRNSAHTVAPNHEVIMKSEPPCSLSSNFTECCRNTVGRREKLKYFVQSQLILKPC